MALSEATQEAVWLKAFMLVLSEDSSDEPVKVYEDNQGAIALVKNPKFHKRTKHIDIRYHFGREKVRDGHVVLMNSPTVEMLADLITKPISAIQFSALTSNLGIPSSIAAVESSGSAADKHLERLSCAQVAAYKDAPRSAQD